MTTLHKVLGGLSVFALAVILLATPLNAADSVLVGTLYTPPGVGVANFAADGLDPYLAEWASDMVVDGSSLYLAQPGAAAVSKFQGSTLVETYGGLDDVFSIALRSDGALFAVSRAAGTQVIKKWGGANWVDFASSAGVTVTPSGRIVFGPDKTGDGNPDLYVACTDGVYYCDGQTGGALTLFASREGESPQTLAFRPTDGNLYAGTTGPALIEIFNGFTGAWISTANYGDFSTISDLMWGPDKSGDGVSDLYIAAPVNQGMWVTPNGAYPFYASVHNSAPVSLATIAPGSLTVHVNLLSFSGDIGLSPVRIELIKNGAVVRNQVAFLNSSGDYTLTAVTPDTYDVAVSSKTCLRRIATGVIVPGNGTGTTSVSLPNGDMDGSGVVDLNDFSIVDTNFGLTNE